MKIWRKLGEQNEVCVSLNYGKMPIVEVEYTFVWVQMKLLNKEHKNFRIHRLGSRSVLQQHNFFANKTNFKSVVRLSESGSRLFDLITSPS